MAKIRVLAVDDEPVIVNLVTAILENHGYQVTTAESGKQALQMSLSKSSSFDVLLTDIIMPDMDGRQLAIHLENHGIRTPILFMSGYASEWDRGEAPASERLVLRKPFTAKELISAVEGVMSERRTLGAKG